MCDIFGLRCAHEGCEVGFPMHISDYCLPRSVIKRAFCEEHAPEDSKGEYLSDTTYKYLVFQNWDSHKAIVVLEIDWEIFGIVVGRMVEDKYLFGLSHLLEEIPPISLNASGDFMLTWR